MRSLIFAKRCAKEILRDPINIIFGLGFPVILLLLLSAIQKNIPADLFAIESLAPGVAVFGLSFITLFSATLISKDRESALLDRLYTTPMRATDFILGYALPIIPIAIGQGAITFAVALALGLPFSVNILYALLMLIPIALLYVALGLLFGSILGVKQVGGICGALLTNLSAWLSGVWFDISLMGEWFEGFASLLPFIHSVELMRAASSADFSEIPAHLIPVLIYTLITSLGAIMIFPKRMKDK